MLLTAALTALQRYKGGPEILRPCRSVGSGNEAKVVVDLYGLQLIVHRSSNNKDTVTVCIDKQVRSTKGLVDRLPLYLLPHLTACVSQPQG